MINEAVLAEYRAVRSESEQLNGQIFTILYTSLGANLTIMGWFYEKASQSYGLPILGIALLFFGNLILLNRNRLSHRLAYFQKYFIEPRVPDICWARVYFAYRVEYENQRSKLTEFGERLAQQGTWVLLIAGVANLIMLFIYTWSTPTLGPGEGFSLTVCTALLILQCLFSIILTDYAPIDRTMRELARRAQLEIADDC